VKVPVTSIATIPTLSSKMIALEARGRRKPLAAMQLRSACFLSAAQASATRRARVAKLREGWRG
jgi:hypothetical protein